MKAKIFVATLVAVSAIAPFAHAGDNDAKVTGLAGGAVTGAIVGGPVGAVVGGAVGLTTGAAIDNDRTKTVIIKKQEPARTVIVEPRPDVEVDQ